MRRLVMRIAAVGALVSAAQAAHADLYEAGRRPEPTVLETLTFRGEPGWLVIGDAGANEREAAARAAARRRAGIAAAPLHGELFAHLGKGLLLVYGAFPQADDAAAFVARLKSMGVDAKVQQSGALVACEGKPGRLVRLWGKLDGDAMRLPTVVDLDGQHASATVATDRDGWYQAWLLVPRDGGDELTISAHLSRKRNALCASWFDKTATVSIARDQRDVYVSWSPTLDCDGD